MKLTKKLVRILDRAICKLEYAKGNEVGVAHMIDSIDLPGQASIYNWVARRLRTYYFKIHFELSGYINNPKGSAIHRSPIS